MRKNNINFESKSKLVDYAAKKTHQQEIETSSGLISKKNPEARTRSFRLRPQDFDNLKKIKDAVNSSEDLYRFYNDTDILRGIISLIASNLDAKKVLSYVKKVQ